MIQPARGQPLHLGGKEDADKGLTMLHPYPEVSGAARVGPTEEGGGGLFFGGRFEDAQVCPPLSSAFLHPLETLSRPKAGRIKVRGRFGDTSQEPAARRCLYLPLLSYLSSSSSSSS